MNNAEFDVLYKYASLAEDILIHQYGEGNYSPIDVEKVAEALIQSDIQNAMLLERQEREEQLSKVAAQGYFESLTKLSAVRELDDSTIIDFIQNNYENLDEDPIEFAKHAGFLQGIGETISKGFQKGRLLAASKLTPPGTQIIANSKNEGSRISNALKNKFNFKNSGKANKTVTKAETAGAEVAEQGKKVTNPASETAGKGTKTEKAVSETTEKGTKTEKATTEVAEQGTKVDEGQKVTDTPNTGTPEGATNTTKKKTEEDLWEQIKKNKTPLGVGVGAGAVGALGLKGLFSD